MFDQVQVRALAGPLKDIQRLVPKPLLRCLGCVLRVIVLLEGDPSSLSEVLSALEWVFINDLSVLCSLYFCTPMLHRKDGARFPPDVKLGIQASIQASDMHCQLWDLTYLERRVP